MLTAKLNTKLLFTQEDKKNPKKEVKLGQFGCPSCYTTALDVSPKQTQNYTSLHSNTFNHKTLTFWLFIYGTFWSWMLFCSVKMHNSVYHCIAQTNRKTSHLKLIACMLSVLFSSRQYQHISQFFSFLLYNKHFGTVLGRHLMSNKKCVSLHKIRGKPLQET